MEETLQLVPAMVLVTVWIAMVWGTFAHNGLVRRKNRFESAYAQIDVQLRRRYELIPRLVEVARGYMKHERETLESVMRARNEAAAAADMVRAQPGAAAAMHMLASAEQALSLGLGRVRALSEAYPTLAASGTMSGLIEELTGSENRIAFARQAYNDAAADYNSARESFPLRVVAGRFGFEPAELLIAIEHPEQRTLGALSFA